MMRAALRLGMALMVAGLALGPLPALAQDADPARNTPAADSIGPRELQGFSLQGTVTRSADPPPAAADPPAQAPAVARTATDQRSSRAPAERPAARQVQAATASSAPAAESSRRVAAAAGHAQRSSITVNLPPVGDSLTPAAVAADAGYDSAEAAPALAPDNGFSLWPWLLAAMALGAGAAFLLWRKNHHREAFAGGPQVDAFVAPQPPVRAPRPAPAPAPAAKPAAPPAPSGIVSTRLRPWIDLTFEPLRCIVEDERVTFEFDLALYNSGSGPAREVLIEASTFNAGATQDQEIQTFFKNPVAEGERIAAIPPLKSFNLRTRVSVERNQVRVLEAAGRQVFVPLLAFNAIYRWGGGDGQTSEAYLLGRDTKGEKMAPFRLDLGARVFRGLGKRALPGGLRR